MPNFILFNEEEGLYINKNQIVIATIDSSVVEDTKNLIFFVVCQLTSIEDYKLIRNLSVDEDPDSGSNHVYHLQPNYQMIVSDIFESYNKAEEFLNNIIGE